METKNPRHRPSPWGTWTPFNTTMPRPTPLTTPNDILIDSRNFPQLRRKVPIGYNETPQIHHQKYPFWPFPFDDNHPHLIHASVDRPHASPQTAPRSTQPFCYNTFSGQTDRPTDRWSRREICINTRLRSIVYSDAANNNDVYILSESLLVKSLASLTIHRA